MADIDTVLKVLEKQVGNIIGKYVIENSLLQAEYIENNKADGKEEKKTKEKE